jgi:hypothetical protein
VRTTLGGRCGDCELQSQCGGCRARAYGVTGDLMAEDPLCTHQPGRFVGSPLLAAPKAEYGLPVSPAATAATAPAEPATAACPVSIPSEAAPLPASTKVAWDDDAAERMKRIPAFVRGMVTRAVEDSCRKQGIARVTLDQLEKIRARMPTPKFFGGGPRPQ